MDKELDLIILPFHDYKKWLVEGFRTRDAHFFESFVQDERVREILVVNRPVSLAERLIKGKGWKTTGGKVIAYGKSWQVVQKNEKVFILDIKTRDFISVILLRRKWWNAIFRKRKIQIIIKHVMDILGMKNKILFLENPMAVGVVSEIGEEIFVFDAIDNWLHHPQMQKEKKIIKQNYDYIARNADLIITVSQDLQRFFGKNNDSAIWMPNGVDIDLFKDAITKSHGDLKVGYVGKIQERVDLDLVEECLAKFPEVEFLMAGPVLSQKKKIARLEEKYKNIKFLGDLSYDRLPSFLKKIDVAIIPHVVNSFTASMNPIKTYEYLAAGKQVVTTDVAGVKGISKYVKVANSNQDFLKCLNEALETTKESDLQRKVASSLDKKHNWKTITSGLIDVIIEKKERKNGKK